MNRDAPFFPVSPSAADAQRTPGLTFDDLPRLAAEAGASLAANDPEAVVRLFLTSYAVSHKSARFHALAATAAARLGRFDQAAAYFRMSAYLAPNNPQWWIELARLEERRNHPEAAEAAARRALDASPYAYEAFDLAARAAQAQGRVPQPRLLLFGDSHAMYFRYIAAMGAVPAPYFLEAHDIGGATAYGLSNLESESGGGTRIHQRLREDPTYARLLFFFGEVDCRRAAWAAAARSARPIDEIIDDAIGNYIGFIDRLAAAGHGPITIIGPILPITDDDRYAVVVRNDPRAPAVSQAERSRISDVFSVGCRAACRERGWGYFDIASDMRDPQTGLASVAFVGDDPWDAHARMDLTADRFATALARHLDCCATPPAENGCNA